MTDETPPHLKYNRSNQRDALLRAEHCADAIVAHLSGLTETRQIQQLWKLARELRDRIQAERKRHNR
jgi:hypothetical protein